MARDAHNLHSTDHAQSLIVGAYAGRPEHSPEGREYLWDYSAGKLTMVCEDGAQVTFDAAELIASDALRAATADALGLERRAA